MSTTPKRAVSVRDVDGQKFVIAYAQHLKKSGQITLPKWVDTVKTGSYAELSPIDPDWFYTRCAAIARNIYMRPGTGVGGLCSRFGGRRRHGVKPEHRAYGYRTVNRYAVQALEKAGVLEKVAKGGRKVTPKGQQDLDRIAQQVIASY